LACVIDQTALEGEVAPLTSFIPSSEGAWTNGDARLPCSGLDAEARLSQAVQILTAAGYTWTTIPSKQSNGSGLTSPDGHVLPAMRLMMDAADALRAGAATYVEHQARGLGLQLATEGATPDVINYAVFSSGDFDAAVVGWTVGRYPGYLCDWFGVEKPFQYEPSTTTSLCGELQATSDLDTAQAKMRQIQSVLAQDVPMIPLYAGLIREPYRNVAYPFSSVLDGLRGVYGAPELALPASP
jgi:ABC-type transport system substrate-binding protein